MAIQHLTFSILTLNPLKYLTLNPYKVYITLNGNSDLSGRKAITLIVEVANAGGAQMILTASTVRFVLNA
jgi:hypothetical protein